MDFDLLMLIVSFIVVIMLISATIVKLYNIVVVPDTQVPLSPLATTQSQTTPTNATITPSQHKSVYASTPIAKTESKSIDVSTSHSTPVVFTPFVSTAVVSTPVISTPVVSTPVVSTQVVSTPVVSTPVVSTPVVSAPVISTPVVSIPVISTPVISTPVVTTKPTSSIESNTSTTPVVQSVKPTSSLQDVSTKTTQLNTDNVTKKTACEETKKLYLQLNKDVERSGMDAWHHYLASGKKEGRKWPGKECRYVTIMYSTWVDHMMKNKKPVLLQEECPQKCGSGYHWWGKPAYKNGNILEYRIIRDDGTVNNDLIDYHADLLHASGIDFITVDLTNGTPHTLPKIFESTHPVVQRYSERSSENTPQIVLWVKNEEVAIIMRDQFYMNPKYNSKVWFKYEGKPLILLGHPQDGNPMPKIPGFTVRRCWGLMDFKCKPGTTTQSRSSASVCGDGIYSWTFKQNTKIPGQVHLPFINPENNNVEQMSVCVASQENYMTNEKSNRVGRNNGAYFNEQWNNVMKYKPTFVLITAWNEWGAENQKKAPEFAFVDSYGQEYSSDIEPMYGGHGDMYYRLMKDWITRFKNI